MSKDPNLRQTVAVTNLVGQVGCVTALVALVIIGLSFAGGWFLDNLMGNDKRVMTVIFMLASFPVTLYAMVRISLWMLGRANAEIENLDKQDKDKTAT